jgi:hypothetical protein
MNKKAVIIGIIVILVVAILITPSFTGQAIGNLSQDTSSTLSGFLIIISVLIGFLFLKHQEPETSSELEENTTSD